MCEHNVPLLDKWNGRAKHMYKCISALASQSLEQTLSSEY